jgi:septum formation protein
MAKAPPPARFYLASRSPRRRQLLQRLEFDFDCLDIEVDETWSGAEAPDAYVTRLALEKARAGRAIAPCTLPVLAADTEVVLDSRVLGKPVDSEAAVTMLLSLSGRTHQVYSAVALVHDSERACLNISQVTFAPLAERDCRAYCAGGEPLDKAGAYAIQGRAAAFITRLTGSYSAVMGLPLSEATRLLASAGIIMTHGTTQSPAAEHPGLA